MLLREWIQEVKHLEDERDTKIAMLGLTKLLTDSSLMLQNYMVEWCLTLDAALRFATQEAPPPRDSEEEEEVDIEELAGYEPGFCELRYAVRSDNDVAPTIQDPRAHMASALASFLKQQSATVSPAISQYLSQDMMQVLDQITTASH